MAPATWAAGWADVEGNGGGTAGLHPVMSPSSEAKRNSEAPLCPAPSETTKPSPGLNTVPVGAPPGMFTTSGTASAGWPGVAPRYRVDVLVPLLATHTGVLGPADRPHALTRFGSVICARPATSD